MKRLLMTMTAQAFILAAPSLAMAASHDYPKEIRCSLIDPCKAVSQTDLGKCVDTFTIKTDREAPVRGSLTVRVRENGVQMKTETWGADSFDGMSYPDWDSLRASWDSDMNVELISPVESHFGYGITHVSRGTLIYAEDFPFDVRECVIKWW